MTAAADLFRNLAIAWWPLLLVAALVAAYVLIVLPLAVSIGRAFKAGGEEFAAEQPVDQARMDRLLAIVQAAEPLPAVDAPEADFEAWVARAIKKEGAR